MANIGPADYNFEETLSTLRYANRAKNIANAPVVNEDPKDAMLRQFQEEIARLKNDLATRGQAQPQASQVSLGIRLSHHLGPSTFFGSHQCLAALAFHKWV